MLLESDDGIKRLLSSAKTIAVVGLSDKPYRDSSDVASYLKGRGYKIIPVNPNIASALGLTSYSELEKVPDRIDIVDVFRRSEFVPDLVEAAIRSKARAIWLQIGVIHASAAQRAADAGLTVVMDRCIAVEHRRLIA